VYLIVIFAVSLDEGIKMGEEFIKIETKRELACCPFCGDEPYFTESVNGSQMNYLGCVKCEISLKAARTDYAIGSPMTRDIVFDWNKRANLKWTTEAPKKEGYYFVGHQPNGETIAHVFTRPGHNYLCVEDANAFYMVEKLGTKWAGPIAEPEAI